VFSYLTPSFRTHEGELARFPRQVKHQIGESIHIAERENGASSSQFYQVRTAAHAVTYDTWLAAGHCFIHD
jgi:hypothetical protein